MLVRPPSLWEGCKMALGELINRVAEWWRNPATDPKLGDVWVRPERPDRHWTVAGIEVGSDWTTIKHAENAVRVRLPVLAGRGALKLVRKRNIG